MQEFSINFGKSVWLHSIFLINRCKNGYNQMRIGLSHVRVGNDATAYSTSNTVVKQGIVAGGFFELDSLCEGQYLNLRRDDDCPTCSSNRYVSH